MEHYSLSEVGALCLFASILIFPSCRKDESPSPVEAPAQELVSRDEMAGLLAGLNMGAEQLSEVHDAVCSSEDNGYDSEYTLKSLLENPGSGVGENRLKSSPTHSYEHPLREMISSYFEQKTASKADPGGPAPEEYLEYLSGSDMQIYWPNADRWDGSSYPVVTFDPGSEARSNKGYCLNEDGRVEEMIVTEDTMKDRPVWVINNNEDSDYVSLEVMRKNNPQWGEGGTITINDASSGTKVRTLILQEFVMLRQYDSWFRGASEFFVRAGSVENFVATKDEDIEKFNPTITEFMFVVKRNQLLEPRFLNTVLVSDWTGQLENMALMITEDDGGTVTSWKANAMVKIQSKSYGFELEFPYRSKDDVVWRGTLSRKYLESFGGSMEGDFGEVRLRFKILEKVL